MVLGRAERDRKRTRGGKGGRGVVQGTLLLHLWLKHNTSLCTNRQQLLVELEHMTHQKIQSNRCSGWNKPSRFRRSLADTSKVVKDAHPFQLECFGHMVCFTEQSQHRPSETLVGATSVLLTDPTQDFTGGIYISVNISKKKIFYM